jgi:replication factor C subunit 2/4
MSTISVLQSRLKELSTALAQIHPLVARLHDFTTAVGQGDEARTELGAEIHSRLKEAEDDLELLKVDVDALETSADNRRKGQDSEKETERERVIALARRLSGDLKRWVAPQMLSGLT